MNTNAIKTWQERLPAPRAWFACDMNCGDASKRDFSTGCGDCMPITIYGDPIVARDAEIAELRTFIENIGSRSAAPVVAEGWKVNCRDDQDGQTWLTITTPNGSAATLSCRASTDNGKTIASQVLHAFAAAHPVAGSSAEQAQRKRMQERFAHRASTPATADFDLPAPNDAVEPIPASEAPKSGLSDAGALEMACVVNKKLGDVLAGRAYLLPDDLAALKRFHECATDFDSGGHDVPKGAMARLREIGAMQSLGFGRHQTTAFGDYVLERAEGKPVKLPLKTLAERNEDAAHAAKGN